jgi:hypothetical protein
VNAWLPSVNFLQETAKLIIFQTILDMVCHILRGLDLQHICRYCGRAMKTHDNLHGIAVSVVYHCTCGSTSWAPAAG